MTTMQQEVESKIRVPSADKMDRATFMKHMNFRHADSMEKWTLVDTHMTIQMEKLWRAFHCYLHGHLRRPKVEIDHEHASS